MFNAVIQNILNEKKKLSCALIVTKRAFGSVCLNNLWLKLYRSGLDGKLLRFIKAMYTNEKSCVRNCNTLSDYFEYAIGLQQGEIMSQIFFALFVNDLEPFF